MVVVKNSTFRAWDVGADTFAMTAHNSQMEVMDIARQLNKSGYGVTKAEVGASLQRQGAQNIRWGSEFLPKSWDSDADNFARDLIFEGKPLELIVACLCENGYAVDLADAIKVCKDRGCITKWSSLPLPLVVVVWWKVQKSYKISFDER